MYKEIYKLQIWLVDSDENGKWRDFYFDVNKITGWYIPNYEEDSGKAINIFAGDDCLAIKQEDHIIKWLTENFVNQAVQLTNDK